jgi:hypothetical protein
MGLDGLFTHGESSTAPGARCRSLIKLKIAMFNPIPIVGVTTARKMNPADLRNSAARNEDRSSYEF